MLTFLATASAMSYEQAREQALFLTDKMAYELNLTEQQYDAAYEINLDYLMSVNTPDDLYAAYWTQRNIDLSYILLDWQYRAFCAASYFYRPLYWTAGVWHFAIYSRYPHRNYFYFGRPRIYVTYRGGHSWHHNGGHSWYKGRTFHHGHGIKRHGMRDRFDRGEFRHVGKRPGKPGQGMHANRPNARPDRRPQAGRQEPRRPQSSFRGNNRGPRTNRESSTRTTVRQNRGGNKGFNVGNGRRPSAGPAQRRPSNTFTPKRSASRPSVNRSAGARKSVGGAHRGGGGHRGAAGGGNKGGHNGRR